MPGFRCVNEERGMLGFTGTFDGKPISVQTTGMGCPSAGIVFEELVMLGVRRLIRVGTCGGLKDGMRDGRHGARRERHRRRSDRRCGTPRCRRTPRRARSSWRRPLHSLSREQGATVHVGPVVTSGVFYDPDKTTFARWKRVGHIGVEMEAAMMYTVAAVHGIESLAMMTVSDLLAEIGETERISDDDLKQGVDDMMRLACRVAVS